LYKSILNGLKNVDTKGQLYFAEKMLKTAQKEKKYTAEIDALLSKAVAYIETSDFDKGQRLIELALGKADTINYLFGIAQAKSMLSFCFHIKNKHQNGIPLAKEAIQIFRAINNKSGIAAANMNLGNCYKGLGQFSEAINHLIAALRIYEKNGDENNLMNISYNLAACYYGLGKMEETEKYALQCIKYTKGVHLVREAGAINILGAIALQKGDFDQAIKWFKSGIEINEKLNSLADIGVISSNLGAVYLNKNNPIEALKWATKAIEIGQSLDSPAVLIPAYSSAGAAYTLLKQWDKAISSLKLCLTLCEESGNQNYIQQITNELSATYAAKGDFEAAYNYFVQYHETEKKVFNLSREKGIAEITTKYETEKKEALLAEEKAITNLQKIRLQRNQIMMIGLVVLSLLFSFLFLFYRYQKQHIQIANNQLEVKNEQLNKARKQAEIFLEEGQHRTKNHLHLVASLLDLQSRDSDSKATQNAITEGKNRIEAVGLLNQKLLYQETTPSNKWPSISRLILKTYWKISL